MSGLVKISEIFGPTIQGEGALIGQPTVFVRTGGCDYRCSWCDTLHAVESQFRHDWKPMSAAEIMGEVKRLSIDTKLIVSISGGNPAIQDLSELLSLGKDAGYRFALETQGSVSQDWFADLDVLTLSPKPPSSGMETDWGKLEACITAAGADTEVSLKIVVFDDADYDYARDVAARHPALPVYLQPGNHQVEGAAEIEVLNERMRWLVDKALGDQWFEARILPQLHVMLWGNKQGV
ncbi:MAG: 7-carboxy-7-deazaguanine synthase QueE [Alphaproteobacteria bacterium]